MNVRLLLAAAAFLLGAVSPCFADIAGEPARVHVIRDVDIVSEPGARSVRGSIVIRDGRIEMIGAGTETPPDALVHERSGRTVYPGLIEAYLRVPATEDSVRASVRSHVRAAEALPLDGELLGAMRESGFTTALVAPDRGVFRGTAAVVSLGDGTDQVIDRDHAQIFAFEHGGWLDRTYPASLMGAIALARQTLHDTAWDRDAWAAWHEAPESVERPSENPSLRALRPVVENAMPLFFESEDLRMLPRALAIAREFRLVPVIVSGGSDEYRRINRVKQWLSSAKAALVLTVDFPRAPVWKDEEERVAIELDDLRHWELAPTNPGRLERSGIPFSVTTQGLEKRTDVFRNLRRAIRHGLSEETALASLTTAPAALLGIAERTGTLEPGKDANLLVATGDLFAPGTEIEEVWIDGVRYGEDARRATPENVEGRWDLVWGEGAARRELRVKLAREDGGALTGHVVVPSAPGSPPAPLEEVELVRGDLTFAVPENAGLPSRASFALRRDFRMLLGDVELAGELARVSGRRVPPEEAPEAAEFLSESVGPWPPEYDAALRPESVHVKNAVIWTCGPEGVVENADLLVTDGKVRAVGRNLPTPRAAAVLDGAGRHITPGLIDCHSHSSICGDVNEGTHCCTAEVRIADVVNSRSTATYRELAGGLTVSNLLHGSANAIGGQNAVVKLRWGEPAEDLLFEGAPPGIKFALGENVKQSNWGEDFKTRYPQTRMGVEQFIRDAFVNAESYRRKWNEWRKTNRGAPPRRDLGLDALVEVLDGDRLVHCHAYRADEIIMLMRVAEDFGFRIRTFQHVLEGYKCANELAEHGAGASSFSDWWSYKYEVVDAIPYNGEILWRRGVRTSFNSDSWEVSRRMNLEGAKAVKYGGVPEEEALAFVTINPAIQLGIDDRVGSLEEGKDADFVVWSTHPLSDAAVCEETWIEGALRFSRKEDLRSRKEALALREKLLARAQASWRAKEGNGAGEEPSAFGARWGEGSQEAGLEIQRGECRETRTLDAGEGD